MAKKKTSPKPKASRKAAAKRPAVRTRTTAAPRRTVATSVATASRPVKAGRATPPKSQRPAARRSPAPSVLFAPVAGAERREVGHVQLEVGRAGEARVKRMIYPPGFRWSVDMKPAVGTDLCMHAHVGFLVSGEIHIEYADGCVVEHRAPQVVAIEPGHDGWVVGREPVVIVEFDFERDTIRRLGMPDAHRHD
ncbi:MAG: hypothetical protein ABI211_09065 [Vicinamibacterales bacterium]